MRLNRDFRNKTWLFFVLSIVFFLAGIFFTNTLRQESGISDITSDFENVLHAKEIRTDKLLREVSKLSLKNPAYNFFDDLRFKNLFAKEGLVIIIYQNNKITFWSDNTPQIPVDFDQKLFNKNFLNFGNGWYVVRKITTANKIFAGLILIKNDYKNQNKYLVNNFQKSFNALPDTKINTAHKGYNIYNCKGNYLFSLEFKGNQQLDDSSVYLIFLVYLLGFIFFISFIRCLYECFHSIFPNQFVFISTFILDLSLLRFIIYYLQIPQLIFQSRLFSPLYYASSAFLPSLGDLLLDVIVILFISYFFYKHFEIKIKLKRLISRYLLSVILFTFIIGLFYGLIYLFSSLVLNSTIILDLNNIFWLNFPSITIYIIIVLLIFSFILIVANISNLLIDLIKKFHFHLFISIITAGIFYFLLGRFIERDLFYLIFLLIYLNINWFLTKKRKNYFNFYNLVFQLLMFAFLTTYSLYQYNSLKEKESRKIVAMKISTQRDKVAEFMFKEIETRILSDTLLNEYLPKAPFDEKMELKTSDYILHKYFEGYWSKYNFKITICDEKKDLSINPNNFIINCDSYFGGIVKDIGETTLSKRLFYLNDGSEEINYLAILPFSTNFKNQKNTVNIFIEINSKFVPRGVGYPELLVDKSIEFPSDYSGYSYGFYVNGELAKNVGKYYYSIYLDTYGKFNSDFVYFDRNGFNHLYYKVGNGYSLIISKKNPDLLVKVAPFSYLFIFFGLCAMLFWGIIHFPRHFQFVPLNFKSRIQLYVISIIVVSFIFIGIFSLLYLIKLNKTKNIENLSEKGHSVLVEMEHNLASEKVLTFDMSGYLNGLLNKWSFVFFTDINLYDLNGNLIASSRPQIFDDGLISKKMNSVAFNQLNFSNKTLLIQDEKIGNYKFLSAYLPFRNNQNKLIAYLNLPYFAKQGELKQEISTFLIAFTNIYILLIALAVLVALIIGNHITRPLQLIKNKISNLKLGKPGEKIEWHHEDEIGGLIVEYNRMIDKLAESALLLSKSERESAWREMAKQVAHEIKNPLTPMKLSVQYLQKAWDDKAPDWGGRLKHFTTTIVEQIDTLSEIASEFSDFAKMPQGKNGKTDLWEVLVNVVELYKESPDVTFTFHPEEKQPLYVLADKKQLLRVFNNLIKNSLQAIGNAGNGLIEISVKEKENQFLISIHDNGSGIAREQRGKIFSPNFTTKSGGMGLGLAIVKSIITDAGGEIWFESKPGDGTWFFISLPQYKKD